MGIDIATLKSHPDKPLLKHVQGVRENVSKLSDSKIADLLSVFHDLGKINPNFQKKLLKQRGAGYSNHSYLSAFAFFCAFCGTSQGHAALKTILGIENLTSNDLIAIITLLAKHHANIPDFIPEDRTGAGVGIIDRMESEAMFNFLKVCSDLPVFEYVLTFYDVPDFASFLSSDKVQNCFLNSLHFVVDNQKPLDFFMETQFAFACLIQADKADAGKMGNFISEQQERVVKFSISFGALLEQYLAKLNQDTELNRLRTTIRNHAAANIRQALSENERIFELTAPTGSGKTLMLLSLASEIIKMHGSKRIIYILPFLSITEQVESEVLKIFHTQSDNVQRVDSRSENVRFEKIQQMLENEVSEDNLQELNVLEFQENTFAYPFIITTFVRFFETLLSNRNSELLKLPNFANCIFLIDEVQALPPRLYGFFIAYITKFCRKFGSFAIISTATQPNFELPNNQVEVREFFNDYQLPKPLLPLSYFQDDLFNRYTINYEDSRIDIDSLSERIIAEDAATLVILNTIDDSKALYEKLLSHFSKNELLLLNTHFTTLDRKLKIYLAKRRLRQNQKVIVVSTQLIEAGVDIDFPVLYRDFATVASIVQSAGRCNRNGKLQQNGKVVLFRLEKDGRPRSELIYRGKDADLLRFTKESLTVNSVEECSLLGIQQSFFNKIHDELHFARYGVCLEGDFLKEIKECAFETIGKFQLIEKQEYGMEYRYYVPRNNSDTCFEKLLSLQSELKNLLRLKSDISVIKQHKNKIDNHLKRMSNRIVQVRKRNGENKPGSEGEYFDLHKLDLHYYSFDRGIDMKGGESII